MTISDFSITSISNKYDYYESQPPIRYSAFLKRWLCFDRQCIQDILSSPLYGVHDYDVSEIQKRFSINLSISQALIQDLPLSHEGELHLILRNKYIDHINKNIKFALGYFQNRIRKINFQHSTVDLIPEIHSAIMESNAVLAGLDPLITSINFIDIGLVFDDRTSLKKRIEINKIFEDLIDQSPQDISYSEKIFRVALLTVGTNALLGAVSESLLNTLLLYPAGHFSEIIWEDQMPAAGIAIIERIATQDTMIYDNQILKGDTIRCYIENLGYKSDSQLKFNSGYFAAPSRHGCPGMKYSLEIWRILKEVLSSQSIKYQLIDYTYRENDPVFNFPTKIRIKIE